MEPRAGDAQGFTGNTPPDELERQLKEKQEVMFFLPLCAFLPLSSYFFSYFLPLSLSLFLLSITPFSCVFFFFIFFFCYHRLLLPNDISQEVKQLKERIKTQKAKLGEDGKNHISTLRTCLFLNLAFLCSIMNMVMHPSISI